MKTKMLILSFAIYALSSIVGCAPSEKDVLGEVFIVTKGGQNIKLGLVEIGIVSESAIKPYIQPRLQAAKIEITRRKPTEEKLKKEIDLLVKDDVLAFKQIGEEDSGLSESLKRYNDIRDKLKSKQSEYLKYLSETSSYTQGAFYISALPTPIFTTKTDGDGKFTFKLQPGKYALAAASASRQVGDNTEKYYWLIWITVDPKKENKIMLSNDNLFESGCKEGVMNIAELLH